MTLWISHRGVCSELDENTAAAFDLAVQNGYRHLETDLRMTADGRIVHWHDAEVRDVHGNLFRIDQTGSEVLSKLCLPKGGSLIFFDEFCSRYAGIGWTLDIKAETGTKVLSKLSSDEFCKANLRKSSDVRFLVWKAEHIDFVARSLTSYRRYASKRECVWAGLAALTGIGTKKLIDSKLIYAVTPKFAGISMFSTLIVSRYRNCGASIIAYLPSSYEEVNAAIKLGIEEILSDLPRPVIGR